MVGGSGLGAQHNPWPACFFMHSLNRICSCCSQSQDDNTMSGFAAPSAASVDYKEIKDGSSWCDNKWTATFCSNWAHSQGWIPESPHSPANGMRKNIAPRDQSNIFLDTVGKICCYRIIPYSFLETVSLKRTSLGWVKKRDFEQMGICLHWKCLFSLTLLWVNFPATWSRECVY